MSSPAGAGRRGPDGTHIGGILNATKCSFSCLYGDASSSSNSVYDISFPFYYAPCYAFVVTITNEFGKVFLKSVLLGNMAVKKIQISPHMPKF